MTHTNNDVFGSIEHSTIIYPRDLWFIYWIMGSQGWFVSTYPLILLHMNFQQTFVCVCQKSLFVWIILSQTVVDTCQPLSVICPWYFGKLLVNKKWTVMILRALSMTCRSSRWRHFLGLAGPRDENWGQVRGRARCYNCLKRSILTQFPTDVWSNGNILNKSPRHVETVVQKQKRGGTNYESPTKVSYHCTSWYIRDAYTFNLWSI